MAEENQSFGRRRRRWDPSTCEQLYTSWISHVFLSPIHTHICLFKDLINHLNTSWHLHSPVKLLLLHLKSLSRERERERTSWYWNSDDFMTGARSWERDTEGDEGVLRTVSPIYRNKSVTVLFFNSLFSKLWKAQKMFSEFYLLTSHWARVN